LPLQSCRMFASCWRDHHFRRRRETIDRDGSGFRTTIETDTAPGAVMPGITRRMDAVVAQLRSQFQALGRAGLDTQPASFALLNINRDIAARWARHVFTSKPQSVPLADVATTSSSRNTRKAFPDSRDGRSQSAPWPARELTCRADTPLHIR